MEFEGVCVRERESVMYLSQPSRGKIANLSMGSFTPPFIV